VTAKLTPKQEMFCLEYLKDLNATQAAIRAGYSEKTATSVGSENLRKPDINAKIQELFNKRAERILVDADWVLRKSVELHDRCAQAKAVTDRDGNPILSEDGQPVYKFEHVGVAKALELIGKHVNIQAFNEKQTSEVTHLVSEPLANRLFGGSKK
jgi:phage terminase small subunit